MLQRMLHQAEVDDRRDEHTNPCTHVERFKEKRRSNPITGRKLVALSDALVELEVTGPERKGRGGDVIAKERTAGRKHISTAAVPVSSKSVGGPGQIDVLTSRR